MGQQAEGPELELGSEPFPENVQGHTLADSEKTMAIGVALYCFKRGTNAFPSIPLAEQDGLDIRSASNAKFLYFWGKGRLFAVSVDDIIASARFHLTGKTEKKALAKKSDASTEEIKDKRLKVTCATCGEIDIDLFTGNRFKAVGKNGWVIGADKALCPGCHARTKA